MVHILTDVGAVVCALLIRDAVMSGIGSIKAYSNSPYLKFLITMLTVLLSIAILWMFADK